MPSREWWLRVEDILNAIADIQASTAEMSFEDFRKIEKIILQGILYNLIIIGEASVNVNDGIKSCYPQIPWRLRGVIGTGNEGRLSAIYLIYLRNTISPRRINPNISIFARNNPSLTRTNNHQSSHIRIFRPEFTQRTNTHRLSNSTEVSS